MKNIDAWIVLNNLLEHWEHEITLQYTCSHRDDRRTYERMPPFYQRRKSILEKFYVTLIQPHFDGIFRLYRGHRIAAHEDSPSLTGRWKSDEARSGLCGGWGTTDQHMRAIAAVVRKEVWGRALSRWSLMSCTLTSGRFRRMVSFSLRRVIISLYRSLLIVHSWSKKSITIIPPPDYPKKCDNDILARTSCLEFLWLGRTATAPFHGLPLRFWIVKVGPGLIAGD